MNYAIETGVPIPAFRPTDSRPGPRTDLTQALAALEVAQSVLVEDTREHKAAMNYIERAKPRRFTVRKVAHEGWRIWRIE